MNRLFVTIIAGAGLLALPAMAQTSGSSSNSSKSPPSATEMEQSLHQDLSKAGFTDIQIVPGSFLVRAKNSKGQPTEMMVSPNSLTEITAVSPSGGSSQSGSNTSKPK